MAILFLFDLQKKDDAACVLFHSCPLCISGKIITRNDISPWKFSRRSGASFRFRAFWFFATTKVPGRLLISALVYYPLLCCCKKPACLQIRKKTVKGDVDAFPFFSLRRRIMQASGLVGNADYIRMPAQIVVPDPFLLKAVL